MYGADSVRWFILSDSPPEKDIQWSYTGIKSANKFLQKIWDINAKVASIKNNDQVNKSLEEKFKININNFINRIDHSIKNFKFNVAVALFNEVFRLIKDNLDKGLQKKVLIQSTTNIMRMMIPFTPHIAYECLEKLNFKENISWPKIEKKIVLNEVKIAVQINGKTKTIIEVKKDMDEINVKKHIIDNTKFAKTIGSNEIKKIIFVKNRIINFLI